MPQALNSYSYPYPAYTLAGFGKGSYACAHFLLMVMLFHFSRFSGGFICSDSHIFLKLEANAATSPENKPELGTRKTQNQLLGWNLKPSLPGFNAKALVLNCQASITVEDRLDNPLRLVGGMKLASPRQRILCSMPAPQAGRWWPVTIVVPLSD